MCCKERFIIGFTGGSGTGKTVLTEMLKSIVTSIEGEEYEVNIIDADKVARDLQMPGMRGAEAIRREFGSEYFDDEGNLLRKKMASLVFTDEAQLHRLNAVMFPIITEVIKTQLESMKGMCLIDAAVLYESGMDDICDYIIVATADEHVRIKRIMERDGITKKQATERAVGQHAVTAPDNFDVIIDTAKPMWEVHQRMLIVYQNYIKRIIDEDCK